ncbi:hypothetical protein Plec18167_002430 [Paecilomyces lecythidis]|uniref:Mitochondrial K+-H+ exchange-related-domain-containing protein n=1 Tax=Paecilomyces lecythidis TaxID=3004212 RepID=A0ABR3Y564_9EURO
MRLFLLPISTRRALIYGQPLAKQVSEKLSYTDKLTLKVAQTWSKWEEADKGWKKSLVTWGNTVQQRIPYEEWGLKSVPPLNERRRMEETTQGKKIDLLFPSNAIKSDKVIPALRKLATERQDLHRKRMWWSIIIAPFTAPVALIPVIPNIPFFYLAYRGWSHWRALSGSKHLEFLVEKDLLNPIPSPDIEHVYARAVATLDGKADLERKSSSTGSIEEIEEKDEKILLNFSDGKELAKILNAPELAVEVERAVTQISKKLKQEHALVEEGKELESSKTKSKETK